MRQAGLLRATLTLLAGGALAQVLPLLLGPWLTRLYSPTEFGQFSFVWTLATNLAVVGCARYEFALPLESDERRVGILMALCARVLLAVTAVGLVVGLVLIVWQDLALGWLLPLAVRADRNCVWAQFSLMLDERPRVQQALQDAGIPTAIHYPKPLHRQPAYARPDLHFPHAESAAQRVMSLPMSADLSDAQQDAVIAALRRCLALTCLNS